MSLALYEPLETHPAFSDPRHYVRHLVTDSKSSFTLGMKAMTRARREAIFAVYAFCRIVDNIADEKGAIDEKHRLLNAWRAEIDQLYLGKPRSLIGRALREPILRFNIPRQEFLLMIDGMEMDVNGPVQAPDLETLLYYTRCVAGSVGMMSIRIFGVSDCEARDRFALNLADALQLTNILRDIEEDALIGRLYLPRDYLVLNGIEMTTPALIVKHERLQTVCCMLGALARARFVEARRALGALQGEPTRSARMMMGVYEAYLERMERADFQRDPTNYKMSKWRKLRHGLRYALFFPNRPLPDPPANIPPLATISGSL